MITQFMSCLTDCAVGFFYSVFLQNICVDIFCISVSVSIFFYDWLLQDVYLYINPSTFDPDFSCGLHFRSFIG